MKTYWQIKDEIVGPAIKEDFDQIGQKKTREALESFIIKENDSRTLLLDAGCNTGVEAFRLMQKGFQGKYLGVDSNSKAIKLASDNLKKFKNVKFEMWHLEELPFKDSSFDIVLSKDVIEHHKHYERILSELTRVVRKWFILSMFIKPSNFFPDKIKLHPDGYYLNRYNKRLLIDFIMERGFNNPSIIYKDYRDVVFAFSRIRLAR